MEVNNDTSEYNICAKKQKLDIEYYINFAKKLISINNYTNAKKNLDIVLKLEPLNIDAHIYYACIYIQQKKINKLINCCKKIIQLQPNNFYFYYNIGNCYIKKKILLEAELYFLNCLKINPAYIKARTKLIYIYMTRKQLFNQKIQYEELLKYEPTNKDAIHNLELINNTFNNIIIKYNQYFSTSLEIKSDRDILNIEKIVYDIIHIDKTNIPIRLILLDYLYILDKYDEYINLNRNILTINKYNLDANNNLLKIYLKLHKYTEAIDICINLIHIDPINPSVLYNLAKIYYKENKYEKSIIICNKILMEKLENIYLNTYLIIVNIYIKQNKLDDAEFYIRKILELKPYDLEMYELLIKILNKNNKIEEVIIESDKKLEIEFYTLLVDLI